MPEWRNFKTTGIKSAGGIIERITDISQRLDKVIIENKPAIELINNYDTAEQFFYCNPPYTKGVEYEVVSTKDFDHKGLADTLKNIKGRFLLSYDATPKIRELYKDFTIIEVQRQKGINNYSVKDR